MSENVKETKTRRSSAVSREEFEALRTLVHQLIAAVYPQQAQDSQPKQKFR